MDTTRFECGCWIARRKGEVVDVRVCSDHAYAMFNIKAVMWFYKEVYGDIETLADNLRALLAEED